MLLIHLGGQKSLTKGLIALDILQAYLGTWYLALVFL